MSNSEFIEKKEEYKRLIATKLAEIQEISKKLEELLIEDRIEFTEIKDKIITETFNISVNTVNKGHYAIDVPMLSSRKKDDYSKLLYAETLERELYKHKENNAIKPINKGFVVYEHRGKVVRDNDNYNQSEQKQILDSIVTSGILSNDKGINVGIISISTYVENLNNHTRVHIIDADSSQEELYKLLEDSYENNSNNLL